MGPSHVNTLYHAFLIHTYYRPSRLVSLYITYLSMQCFPYLINQHLLRQYLKYEPGVMLWSAAISEFD